MFYGRIYILNFIFASCEPFKYYMNEYNEWMNDDDDNDDDDDDDDE